MNEADIISIENYAKETAMGNFLSSYHSADQYEKVITALETWDLVAIKSLEILLWRAVEDASYCAISENIQEQYDVVERGLFWAYALGKTKC